VKVVSFEVEPPVAPSAPNRTDVACFVGFVGTRGRPVPTLIRQWLVERGWLKGVGGTLWVPDEARVMALLDVPVPIESWAMFDRLFAWDRRPVDERIPPRWATTYLGAAVRSFFAQGGRKCYVVRVGDPCVLTARAPTRRAQLGHLLPGFPGEVTSVAVDPASWRGVGHLFGLPDVSFLCLPDLADIVRADRTVPAVTPHPPPRPERFLECSDGEQVPSQDQLVTTFPAPTCDRDGYQLWAQALERAAFLLAPPADARLAGIRGPRVAQLIAALPLPDPEFKDGPVAALVADLMSRPLGSGGLVLPSLGTSFLQLVYPWARTPGSANLPGALESPDAVLTGVLARNALTRGSYRSAAGLELADVYDLSPLLTEAELSWSPDPARSPARRPGTFADHVSVLGRVPAGMRVLTDVTASRDEVYRPGGVHRLMSTILRAAQRIGEDIVFEPSGERVWATIQAHLSTLMLALYDDGALRGASATDAFQVRCDRSTMSQNDIDNGRLIVELQFQAAAPIEHVTVQLALDASGQISLLPRSLAALEAA
jgi:Bacteriophage tail sheath protein